MIAMIFPNRNPSNLHENHGQKNIVPIAVDFYF